MRVKMLIFVTLLAMTPHIAQAEDKPPTAAPTPAPKQEFVYLEFTGVEESELPAVMDALVRLDGVRSVAWTAPGREAKVVREPGKAAHSLLVKAALDSGAATAGVVPITVAAFRFDKILHCPSCVKKVNRAVLAVPGTKESAVAGALDRVTVAYDSRVAKPQAVLDALARAEFPATASTP